MIALTDQAGLDLTGLTTEHDCTLRSPGFPGLGAELGRREPVIQDEAEELANTVTHGLGLVLSLAGLYFLAVITRG